ncbi:hypothetical protein OOZ63_10450 [Paucibacter sp. PLA-PC-4]|uniref:hypothetical protein n=1 Tax=Paucibacter sp. PLA-PC-4 TaxID=2993655 RepID=UPI0022490A9E|nr:hypothetical protein [Paucibacter sp. PLA-PC-4]MCX2862260.1 hypothetical protein [Paucibacter sp. PLA-PC-4]
MSDEHRANWVDAVLERLLAGTRAHEDQATLASFAAQVRAYCTPLAAHAVLRSEPPTPIAMGILAATLRGTFGPGAAPEQIIRQLYGNDANLLVTAFGYVSPAVGSVEDRACAMLVVCSVLRHTGAWPARQLLDAQTRAPNVLGWSGMASLFAYCDLASLCEALEPRVLVANSSSRTQLAEFVMSIAAAVAMTKKDLVNRADMKKALDEDILRSPRGSGTSVTNFSYRARIGTRRRSAGDDSNDASLARFLQQQAFCFEPHAVPAQGGFRADSPCAIDIRVGPAEEAWNSLPCAFPDHLLPPGELSTLTVWLSEPTYIRAGVQGSLKIAPHGPSSTCRLTFTSGPAGNFDGRLTLLHNGRVLQTARLLGKVLGLNERPLPDGTPHLEEHVVVSHRLSSLDASNGFDLALVASCDSQDAAGAAVYRGEQTQITALAAAAAIGRDIHDALSKAARIGVDMQDGLESEPGRELIVILARQGHLLGMSLFGSGFERRDQEGISKSHRIQLVDSRADGVLPLEFVYDHPSPADCAKPCPNWKAAIQGGDCPGTCPLATSDHSAAHVCPMGFWGLSKIIERHKFDRTKVTPGVATLLAEHSPASGRIKLRGNVVMAFSNRVTAEPRRQVQDALGKYTLVTAHILTSWEEWRAVVSKTNPPLIVGLVHADSNGREATLEIEGTTLSIVDLTRGHVTSGATTAIAPVVLLIGCDIAQALADFGAYVMTFRLRGAAVVVATMSTLYGKQAAAAASRLTDTMFSNPDGLTTIGKALRDTRQQALLHGELLSLSLLAYGDADWELETRG